MVLTSRNTTLGTKAVAELRNFGYDKVEYLHLDLDDATSIKNAATELKLRFPDGIDILINNAGNFQLEMC